MRLDKKQRRLVTVLLLGGAAVFVDRVLLGGGNGPASASADVAALGDDLLINPDGSGAATSSSAPQPAANMQSVAERLEQLRSTLGGLENASDAFALPNSWKRPAPGEAAREAATSAASHSEDEFKAKYAVRSISRLREGESRVVLSDGTILKVGQTIDGWRLASINQQQGGGSLAAVFVAIGGSHSVTLDVPTPTLSGVTVSAPR